MNYVVDKVKEEQKEDVSILTHPHGGGASIFMGLCVFCSSVFFCEKKNTPTL